MKLKKLISKVLAGVMLIGAVPNIEVKAEKNKINATGREIKLEVNESEKLPFLLRIGADTNQGNYGKYIVTDGGGNVAYCVNPDRLGVDSNIDGKKNGYKVRLDYEITESKRRTVLDNGYPKKTPYEMGLQTKEEAYIVTKMVMYTVVFEPYKDISKWNLVPGTPSYVFDAFETLYNKVHNSNKKILKNSTTTVTADKNTTIIDPIDNTYLSQLFNVNLSDGSSEYTITLDGSEPAGTLVTDLKNVPKSKFNKGENFKIITPRLYKERTGEFEFFLNTDETVYMFAKSQMPEISGQPSQDYIIVRKEVTPEIKGIAIYEEGTVPSEGKFKIVKLEAGTTKGLQGAEFKVVDQNKGIIGYFYSDVKGEVVIDPMPYGNYYVEEITPPLGYQLDVNSHKDVIIDGSIEDVIVTFENYKENELEIIKVDEDTNEVLEGGTFDVEGVNNSFRTTVKTDAKGKARISNLIDGVYKVTETIPPKGYILNSTPQEINLKKGEVGVLTFKNQEKPGLEIVKIDKVTGEKLEGGVFRIENNNTGYSEEFTTDRDGEIKIEGLDNGWYTIREIKAPIGYILNEVPKEVYLESNKIISVVFKNQKKREIKIKKVDEITKEVLSGAKFEVEKLEEPGKGKVTGSPFETNSSGEIIIPNLLQGAYKISEINPPLNYEDEGKEIIIDVKGEGEYELNVDNIKKSTFVLNKISGLSGKGLGGAVYEIEKRKENGTYKKIGTYTTNKDGQIVIKHIGSGWYRAREIKAPVGYSIGSNPVSEIYLNKGQNSYNEIVKPEEEEKGDVEVSDGEGNVVVRSGLDFEEISKLFVDGVNTEVYNSAIGNINYPLNSIVIKKTDALTGRLLPGATFDLIKVSEEISGTGGTTIGTYTTNYTGVIVITGLESGAYAIKETNPPLNYDINETNQQQLWLKADGTSIVEKTFNNYPYGKLIINKLDKETKEPLEGAKFKVTNSTGELIGNGNGIYTTDVTGVIEIDGLPPAGYTVVEIEAPKGYYLENNMKVVDIGYGESKSLEFYNEKRSTIIINKLDKYTKEALEDAEFKITNSKGEVIGKGNGIYRTNIEGRIRLENLKPDTYIIKEIKAPKGYVLEVGKDSIVELPGNSIKEVTVYNSKKSSLEIIKRDGETKEALKGAKFKVSKSTGEIVGTYETDGEGIINVGYLETGVYTVVETKAPKGYILNDKVKTVNITSGETVKIEFENIKKSNLEIRKIDSENGKGLSGAKFRVEEKNGKVVGEYETDRNGYINIREIRSGWYTLIEMKAPEGYKLESKKIDVEVKIGESRKIEVENKAYGKLTIEKVIKGTRTAIEGVEFEVRKEKGEVIGRYKTDRYGEIVLNELEEGEYVVEEIKAKEGYKLDSKKKKVEIKNGKKSIVRVENEKLSSLLIRVVDEETGEGIYEGRYMIFDKNNSPIGEYISDDRGYIQINREVEGGKYYIEEIEPSEGYVRDSMRRTIYLEDGKTTEVKWNSRGIRGQIVVTTRSREYNDITKLNSGALLSGAKYEIYNTKNNVVDEITTDSRGIAGTKALPIGIYFIKQVGASKYYGVNDREMWVEIRNDGEIVRLEVLNKSVYLETNVRIEGNRYVGAGERLTYYITDVRNDSNVRINNFYIHSKVPVGTRISSIKIGTFNERLNYNVAYKTNKRNEYRRLASNLLTKNQYEYNLHSNVLGLGADEFIIEIRLEFQGGVGSGFRSLEPTMLEMYVLPTNAEGYEISNVASVGGVVGEEWETSNSMWKTIVDKGMNPVPLPRTGY